MPALLFALAIPIFIGCASTARQTEPAPECLADEFRGFGTGGNENEALDGAYSALAKQINSSVNVTTERTVSQRISNGKEDLASGYESRTAMESSLPNAHDARITYKKHDGNKTNVVVCMTKADAAKGFLERQRLVADSLLLASNTELNTEHPKRKNEAWRRTQMLWRELLRIQTLLEGWGVAKTDYFSNSSEAYESAKSDYQTYCKNMKIHWKDSDSQCSKEAFAELSRRAKLEKSECLNGLNLNFNCLEKCKSSSYGVECSYEPSLAIESCGGEKYSLLKAGMPATGNDMYNESKAKEKLAENFSKATFFNEWEKEVKEWIPQCAE